MQTGKRAVSDTESQVLAHTLQSNKTLCIPSTYPAYINEMKSDLLLDTGASLQLLHLLKLLQVMKYLFMEERVQPLQLALQNLFGHSM